MPIYGLTDQPASFPVVGTLFLGTPQQERTRQDGSTYKVVGRDLKDHFRFEGRDAGVTERFHALYGETPNDLRIVLPYPTTDENLHAYLEEWNASGLVRRCNGRAIVRQRGADGHYHDADASCLAPQCGCQEMARLVMMMPDIARMAHIVLTTRSTHNIAELSRNLRALEALAGTLRGVPLILSRRPKMVSVPAVDQRGQPTGKRLRQEKWLLLVELDPDFVAQQFEAQQRRALSAIMALPAPEDGDGDEAHEADQASAGAGVDHPAGNGVGAIPDDIEAHAPQTQGQAASRNGELVKQLKRCRQAEQDVGLEPTPLPEGLKEVAIRDMDPALLQQTMDGIRQRLRQVLAAVWTDERAQAQQVGGDAPAQVEAQQAADYTGETTGSADRDTLAAAILAARARIAARTASLTQDPVQVVGTLSQDIADSQ